MHFFFKETLAKERRLNLNFQQVLTLYFAILKDRDFGFSNVGRLSDWWGIVLLYQRFKCSHDGSIWLERETAFAYVFGANAIGIMLFSTLNKKISGKLGVLQRLKLGSMIRSTEWCGYSTACR